ncbi:hypothetical protein CDL12_05576 [Handroanthus impetiginosus]|uniref:Uncharacterized protein n=1 Tax=Handroanthus impetiginosus TaxID=429701 RepID=A0A2G9HW27_9LAMI|nr:hypothetical protein CDL12_05576 [Handroanthus impetiginosus]
MGYVQYEVSIDILFSYKRISLCILGLVHDHKNRKSYSVLVQVYYIFGCAKSWSLSCSMKTLFPSLDMHNDKLYSFKRPGGCGGVQEKGEREGRKE